MGQNPSSCRKGEKFGGETGQVMKNLIKIIRSNHKLAVQKGSVRNSLLANGFLPILNERSIKICNIRYEPNQ